MNTSNSKMYVAIAIFLIAFGALMRLLPHAPNFTPLTAIALFSGFYLPKRWAIVVPLTAMFVSDVIIGFYRPEVMFVVYASFAVMTLVSFFGRSHKRPSVVLGLTILASFGFFLSTNASIWAFGTMYDHTLTGLIQSYIAAIPFYRSMLVGDLMYVTGLFGLWEIIRSRLSLTYPQERLSLLLRNRV